MATLETEFGMPDAASEKGVHTPSGSVHESPLAPETPAKSDEMNGSAKSPNLDKALPTTPVRTAARKSSVGTPRFRKKIPWKGKNIQVYLPRDDARGKPGEAPRPLTAGETTKMFRSWEELGYNIRGFDLVDSNDFSAPVHYSQSRAAWPNPEDLDQERAGRTYKVVLPDLNAWKAYVDELNEAKLRALGVSFGNDDPAPSISPASTLSRQASVSQYPPLPFSPPLPTSSASSNHAQFPFPAQLVTGPGSSAAQSPGVPSIASPASFAAKYNPRASISIPSPHAWSPQMLLQQGLARGGSPAVANITALISPTSPFQPDSLHEALAHQRHQSLQYTMPPHQLQQAARTSPRLQEVPEVPEESQSKSPSKTPEPSKAPFIRHNASASLQKEIDEAEYHLEEQMRDQLDHDEDYGPRTDAEKADGVTDDAKSDTPHVREPSVQFVPQPQQPGSEDGPVLHHPQPHSRGHSLSQKYFAEHDDVRDSTDEGRPESRGAPAQSRDLNGAFHRTTSSTASNPWADFGTQAAPRSDTSRRSSHGSKPSISKLNVAAPEFKFNPGGASMFQPSQFAFSGNNFSSNNFQPVVFGARPMSHAPASANSSLFSMPTTASSKINVNAPEFSPGQSDFSFSTTGPKFRPDAPAFTPLHSLSDSLTSPASGSESVGNRASSIFGNIDLNMADVVKPSKKSKAIPIVRPASQQSEQHDDDGLMEDPDGRLTDASRFKRHRGGSHEDDEVALFAQPSETAALPEPHPDDSLEVHDEGARDTQDDDDHTAPADTTLSSTMVSETTDTKDTPLQSSPDQPTMTWAPMEFKNALDMQNFNDARPFGEDLFRKHKKSLSAAAKPFVPGTAAWDKAHADESEEVSDDAAGEPIPNHTDDTGPEAAEESPKQQSGSVLHAEAEEFQPSALSSPGLTFNPSPKGLSTSRFAAEPRKPSGLAASRFAATPSPPPNETTIESVEQAESPDHLQRPVEEGEAKETTPSKELPSRPSDSPSREQPEPTFEEIDAVMRHLDENPTMGVKKTVSSPKWHQPSPTRPISITAVTNASPPRSLDHLRDTTREPPSGLFPGKGHAPMLSTELEDPFVDPPQSARSVDDAVHRLNASESPAISDWEGAFSDEEQTKLDSRANFFDGRVNELFDTLLAARLGPLEKTLEGLQHALGSVPRRTPSSRRDRRSMSAEVQESDADDEDDELPVPRRSMSPRKDRRMEQIRAAVLEAFTSQQASRALQMPTQSPPANFDNSPVMRALDEMKEQFAQSLHLDFRGEDLRNIVEDAVERRMPATPKPVLEDGLESRLGELQAMVADLERRLHEEGNKNEAETISRRAAEDKAAELQRHVELAETRVEVEIMNKSAFDQRVNDLEDKLRHQEERTEEETKQRRTAEDRLSEVQRLLRIASEEETRLRDVVEEREAKIKSMEQNRGKESMRLTLLEAAQANGTKTQSDLQNRINIAEVDLRDARQEARHWKGEAERLGDVHGRHSVDLDQTMDENRKLQKFIDTLATQLGETERVREGWRGKFLSLQQDMAQAAREIAEENARRSKKEQALIARQEVLDAKLQAEARTRERLETEIERLEGGERQGMRAVTECKRLETLLGELRTENHKLQQSAMRYQAEFQEARESAAREVQRTRESMESEVDEANHQVNVVRDEFEEHISRLQSHLDQVKVDAETSRARHDMLLEDMESNKRKEVDALVQKHQNDVEDMQARYERQIGNTTEDAQRAEQNLLERLSISNSKCEVLQDRVVHLEEKLEIAKEAALAAAQAAKTTTATQPAAAAAQVPQPKAIPRNMELPEKISPQALRESIMVLQEQLQARELRIEELEQALAKLDPEAPAKIAKRDDEIIWLRELLAVRQSDLQDIVVALDGGEFDPQAVKDAAIRLKANLQMEEQERERAMNGGSAINLPNIAASLRDAATPRVAQAVGPLAAAWGNWRKSRDPSVFGASISSVLSSPAASSTVNATPARRTRPSASSASQGSSLGGLMTPPTSGLRQTPPAPAQASQPTAFSSTGRRYTPQQLATSRLAASSRQAEKMPMRDSTPPGRRLSARSGEPVTPPMMRPSAYDSDAHAQEFDDAGLFDDE